MMDDQKVPAGMRRVAFAAALLVILSGHASATAGRARDTLEGLLVASVKSWAEGGSEWAAELDYVEVIGAGSRPDDWRFLRIVARSDKVDLVGVRSRATAAADCRLERLRLGEDRRALAAILRASAQALAQPQDEAALAKSVGRRRALVFKDGCHEMSRTFAEPLPAALQALFAQMSALADRTFMEGSPVFEGRIDGRPIGNATIEEDGTLVFDLVAEGPHGERGHAQFQYATTHKDYARKLAHVGGICPGRAGRLVPPYPNCGF